MAYQWDIYNPGSTAPVILAVGSTLGGVAAYQWTPVAKELADEAIVAFIDLPGHGQAPVWDDAVEPTLDDVAEGFMAAIREIRESVGDKPVVFAGLSISGATALHLARDYADELDGVVVLASAATVGAKDAWLERAERVDAEGNSFLVDETRKRWFTPAFCAQQPAVVNIVMEGLASADDHSYAQLCRCLAVHDVRGDLENIALPLMLIAGERDSSTPIANVELVAETVPGAQLHVIPDVAHQLTVCAPEKVAEYLRGFLAASPRKPQQRAQNDD